MVKYRNGNTTIITDNNIEQQEQSINVNVTKNPDKSFSTNMIGLCKIHGKWYNQSK